MSTLPASANTAALWAKYYGMYQDRIEFTLLPPASPPGSAEKGPQRPRGVFTHIVINPATKTETRTRSFVILGRLEEGGGANEAQPEKQQQQGDRFHFALNMSHPLFILRRGVAGNVVALTASEQRKKRIYIFLLFMLPILASACFVVAAFALYPGNFGSRGI